MSISIHALLAESDFTLLGTPDTWTISIHALLAESDPRSPKISILPCQFLSTLSLRRATNYMILTQRFCAISIHALLAESDLLKNHIFFHYNLFLSTLSLRRATWGVRKAVGSLMDFYPRSPCGERPPNKYDRCPGGKFLSTLSLRRATDVSGVQGYRTLISIHALLAESDPAAVPCRPDADISIHALLAESDGRCP